MWLLQSLENILIKEENKKGFENDKVDKEYSTCGRFIGKKQNNAYKTNTNGV